MAQKIDFNALLGDLFNDDMPVKEKVQDCPQVKRNGAEISQALSEIFQTEEISENSTAPAPMNEPNISSLQACSLYVFVKEIIMEHFGMGYDYACEINGKSVKSWFTITETIEIAKSLGYSLSMAEGRKYLDELIARRYFETDNYKYRRRVFWGGMEEYILRNSR